MKKNLFSSLVLILLLTATVSFGQGLENFNNYVGSSGTYTDGTFLGQDGSTWTYTQCRSDRAIVAPSPCMGKNRTPPANVYSGTIQNGCGVISFDYKQAYSTAVNLNLLINGLVYKNVTSPGGTGDTANVHNSGSVTVNVSGDFEIRFEQAVNASSGQVTVDNVTWTGFGGGPLPEPTNYPTAFTAVPSAFTINLSWTDATGAQVPTAYLILASEEDNIELPIDGVPEPNDPNLADGTGALNILPGVQSCQFANLQSNKQFFFKIFPYTNTGSTINYKTDGVPPSATATTPNVAIINYENFNDETFGSWTQYSVIGDTTWTVRTQYGVGGSPYANVTGYDGGGIYVPNEDWLISPAMNFNLYSNEELTFQTAKNYTGPDLEVLISNDYDGTSNPNSADWAPLTATLCPGGWVWTPSGVVNVSGTNGTNVRIAFKFTCTATESATWEVDEILTMGILLVGVPQTTGSRGFSVVPNPSHGQFNLLFGDNSQKEMQIMSVIGQEIFKTNTSLTSLDINVPDLTPGIYFIRVIYPRTSVVMTKKIMIQ
jgi:hypothetical protein